MRSLLFTFALSLVTGCAVAEAPDDTETDEGAITVSQHKTRVERCARALPASASNAEVDAAAAREATCVRRANDATLGQIEQKLGGSSWKGKAKTIFAADRAAFATLCASVEKGGTSGTATKAQCTRAGEKIIARLIGAFVDLGGPAAPIPQTEARGRHAQCFGRFDAQTTRGEPGASAELVRCLESEVRSEGAIIGWRAAPPGFDPDRTQDRVNGEVATLIAANGDLCSVLVASGGGTRDACIVDASHATHEILWDAHVVIGGDL